jgi:cytochrome c-type biogenesis protein
MFKNSEFLLITINLLIREKKMIDIIPLMSLAFISGIITSFQPCLFPLLPTYFSYMNSYKKEKISIQEGFAVSLFLTLGILVIFLLLALLVKIGQFGFSTFLSTHVPEFNLLMSILLIIFGLLMIFGKELTLFYRLPGLSTILVSRTPENNLIASFLLGLAYTAMAAPCAAPIFLSLLFQILFLDPITIVIIMVVYSVGCGVPFLVIGLLYPNFSKEIKTDYKQVVKYIKPISGFILLVMSFYLINNFVLPYYPLIIGSFTFFGFNSELLSTIYIIIFIFLIITILISFLAFKLRKIQKDKNFKQN